MSPMAVSSRDLASALAERFGEIAPPSFRITAQDADLMIEFEGQEVLRSHAPGFLDDDQEGLPEERLETIARAALSSLQDVITEELAEPWPPDGSGMPMPDATLSGSTLRMWFGDEHRPTLQLRSIEFALP